jgi:hypothetical protein
MLSLEEGKIRNLAAVLLMASALARANPMILNIQSNEWKNQNYQQKLEYVQDLFKISDTAKLPEYVSMSNRELSTHKVDPKLIVIGLDMYYMSGNHSDIPVWLAMLKIENKVTDVQIDTVMEKLRRKGIIWAEEDE